MGIEGENESTVITFTTCELQYRERASLAKSKLALGEMKAAILGLGEREVFIDKSQYLLENTTAYQTCLSDSCLCLQWLTQ